MLPPPNVTGSLHMGHGFQDTLMDALIRLSPHAGRQCTMQVGTDHAGNRHANCGWTPTSSRTKNSTRFRGANNLNNAFGNGKNNLVIPLPPTTPHGVSADWSRERFSMDTEVSRAVQTVFASLYAEGLIYRGKRLVIGIQLTHRHIWFRSYFPKKHKVKFGTSIIRWLIASNTSP